MNLLAHIAKRACEHQLHLRVYVLYVVLYYELALLADVIYLTQFLEQLRQLVIGYQSDAVEHGDVGHGAHYVILSQIEVHLAVSAYGEPLYLLVYLKSF